ncbi:hypothetical protein [Nesterenkonia sp.]|uniref:hypothetical protein n=1 Tax=Nesterenkonia sp. TaxID=704201 RepID=UPI002616A70A|nr:hypothetical protein [Nesterenkonia sp.]
MSTPKLPAPKSFAAAASAAALLGLTACGGNDAQAYCDTLESHSEQLAALDDSDPAAMFGEAMDGVVSMLEDSASDVPEEIAEEHAAVQEALTGLQDVDMAALMDVESLMEMDEDEAAELESQVADLEQQFAEMEEQGQRWGDWVEENCDVEEAFG